MQTPFYDQMIYFINKKMQIKISSCMLVWFYMLETRKVKTVFIFITKTAFNLINFS